MGSRGWALLQLRLEWVPPRVVLDEAEEAELVELLGSLVLSAMGEMESEQTDADDDASQDH